MLILKILYHDNFVILKLKTLKFRAKTNWSPTVIHLIMHQYK